jgi:hypothetical protein
MAAWQFVPGGFQFGGKLLLFIPELFDRVGLLGDSVFERLDLVFEFTAAFKDPPVDVSGELPQPDELEENPRQVDEALPA